MAEETAAEAAARARAAQRAAEAPSREDAERAQQNARRRPTAAQASANQAAGGNYADTRKLLINQGQRAYNAAVAEDATRIPRAPGGQRTGYGSPSMPAPPSPFGSAANAARTAAATGARTVARGVIGRIPVVGDLANSRSAGSGSSITSNPDAQRFLAEDAARRAGPDRADANMENPMPQPRISSQDTYESEVGGVTGSSVPRRTDSNIPRPSQSLQQEVQNRAPRPNTRPTTRMSPRENLNEPPVETTTERLNRISQETNKHGGRFVSVMNQSPGSEGEIARNIMNRRAQLARENRLESMKRGGPVKKMAKGGVVSSSASSRSDGCVTKGRTKGRMV